MMPGITTSSALPLPLPDSSDIELQIACSCGNLPDAGQLATWVAAARLESDNSTVVIRIVDRDESRRLNRDYRGKDKPTNVLSFPFEAPPGVVEEHLGDLVICAPVVEAEAEEQNKSLTAHWAHMVVHGVLHLQGLDHQNNKQAEEMESLERKILADLGYPDPYGDT